MVALTNFSIAVFDSKINFPMHWKYDMQQYILDIIMYNSIPFQ